ncbi:hypothetical protein [Streptomyces brasiliensis]|uniref:Uncharacterized protein n=1 Tax=Streptomyces brasiliensis TaxID=1954 RepID=A0A917P1L8_9ACTN|nr:hypothetical protein [Streptomyces brasiliensis]GGJ52715.1 hypothetical protein GCM10010121_074460 [Streptomyces brasiliensis]
MLLSQKIAEIVPHAILIKPANDSEEARAEAMLTLCSLVGATPISRAVWCPMKAACTRTDARTVTFLPREL